MYTQINRDDSVPPCIRAANIQNDPLEPTDKIAMILCPQYSETGNCHTTTTTTTHQYYYYHFSF